MATKSPARLRFLSLARPLAYVGAFALPLTAKAAVYYVAPTGSDSAAGTETAPFATWARAQTAAAPGDTVYFRAGRYKYVDATNACSGTGSTVSAVVLSKSGTSGNPIKYWAYPGEKPVFDFSGMTKYSCRQVGVNVEADYLYLKGLELTGTLQVNNLNHESWCVYVNGGSNNTFELLDAHHNMGPGFFIVSGGNNTFLNCDSHENEDTLTSNGDGQSADGFGCHPKNAGDTGNIFHGCRSWWNSDDSWDFINSHEACTVEYSWAWYSGYKPDAINNGQPVALAAGNGNGFKGGGYGDPQTNVPSPTPQHIIRENLSFYNKASGLYANHEIVSPFFYNNTTFNNGTDVNMLGLNGSTTTSVGTLRNNIAYSTDGHALTSNMGNGGPISDQFNSWDISLGLKLTDADFQSVTLTPPASCPAPYSPGGTPCCQPTDMKCFSGMASARQSDGSLPVLPFMRLSANSSLIGKGTDVGLPHTGSAPDLGCFDHGVSGITGDGGTVPIGGGTSGSTTGSGNGATSGSGSASGSDSQGDAAATSGSDTSGASGSATGSGGPSSGDSTASGSSGSTASGSIGATGDFTPSGSGTGQTPGAPDAGTSGTGGNGAGSESNATSSGGCSLQPGQSSRGWFSVLGLTVLALVVRRRRQARA